MQEKPCAGKDFLHSHHYLTIPSQAFLSWASLNETCLQKRIAAVHLSKRSKTPLKNEAKRPGIQASLLPCPPSFLSWLLSTSSDQCQNIAESHSLSRLNASVKDCTQALAVTCAHSNPASTRSEPNGHGELDSITKEKPKNLH